MSIVCFTGFSKSGKDTCARILGNISGYPSFHFSKKLKEDLANLLGIDKALLYSATKDTTININGSLINLRKAMRDLSWVFKNQDPAYYAKHTISEMGTFKKAIITDLRFTVEHEELIKTYGKDVFIINVKNNSVVPDLSVISETEHLNITPNIIIENDGSLRDLSKQIITIYQNHLLYNKE